MTLITQIQEFKTGAMKSCSICPHRVRHVWFWNLCHLRLRPSAALARVFCDLLHDKIPVMKSRPVGIVLTLLLSAALGAQAPVPTSVQSPKSGQGRAILFAFPPQHRGQSHATFRLFFNALHTAQQAVPATSRSR